MPSIPSVLKLAPKENGFRPREGVETKGASGITDEGGGAEEGAGAEAAAEEEEEEKEGREKEEEGGMEAIDLL